MQSRTAHALVLSDAAARQQARQDRALADVEEVIRCGISGRTPPVAVASGIRRILYEQLGMDLRHGGPAAAAMMAGWLLRHRPGPFTAAVQALAGGPVRIEQDPGSERVCQLPAAAAVALGRDPDAELDCWERRGLMIAAGTVACAVRLRVVPALAGGMDGPVMRRIRAGEPCGRVLPGLARAARHARVHAGDDPAVTAGATLRVVGHAFGFADEEVTGQLAKQLS